MCTQLLPSDTYSKLPGKTDACFFDKTGTITTDELVADKVISWSRDRRDAPPGLTRCIGFMTLTHVDRASRHSPCWSRGSNHDERLPTDHILRLPWSWLAVTLSLKLMGKTLEIPWKMPHLKPSDGLSTLKTTSPRRWLSTRSRMCSAAGASKRCSLTLRPA